MDIKQALEWGEKKLKNLTHPRLEAEVLLIDIFKKDRSFLKTHESQLLTKEELLLYKKFVQKRTEHIPTAQILGIKNWGNLKILIKETVLIPRDETEILCEHIFCSYKKAPPSNILDIGTGSGCIAIALKTKFSSSKVIALDVSDQALLVAKKNSKINHVDIEFLKSNLLQVIHPQSYFNLIVANLPYLPDNMEISPEVQKEPSIALFSGKDGLDHIRQLKSELETKKITFQSLWLEFLPQQKEEISQIFGSYKVDFFTDAGKDVFFAKIRNWNHEL